MADLPREQLDDEAPRPPQEVSADQFIAELFAEVVGAPVICFIRPTERRQSTWTHDFFASAEPGPWFFCIATTRTVDVSGYARRRKQDLERVACIVLDDIGTKVDRSRVEAMLPAPSWELETSPGNYQWGYILDCGADPAEVEPLLRRIADLGLTDTGAKDVAHVFRVPGSLNEKHAPPFVARLELWQPERRYIVEEIGERLPPPESSPKTNGHYKATASSANSVDEWLKHQGMVVRQRPDGGVDIRCPWAVVHTTGSDGDSSTSYWPAGTVRSEPGFKCLHGHCAHRTVKDLHAWICGIDPGFRFPRSDGAAPRSDDGFGAHDQAPPPDFEAGGDWDAEPDEPNTGTANDNDPKNSNTGGQAVFDGFNFGQHFAGRFIGKTAPAEPILVADMIPDERAVLFTADGGAGKSVLMQTLATCIASADKPFLGRATEHGIAVYFTGEDRDDDLHRRQERICKSLEIDLADVAKTLALRSIVDHDIYLFSQGWVTPMLERFETDLATLNAGQPDGRRVRLAVIDSSSFVYDDNENDRRVVSRFMRALNRMAGRLRCTIILIAHTSRSSDGTVARMSSGSTGWTFGARGALFMEKTDEGATLKVPKANYTKAGLEIELRWDANIVLVPVEQETGVLKNIQQRKDDEAVLAEVTARWKGPGEPLSKTPSTGDRYLPTYMARAGKMKQGRAKAAMVRLLDAGKITTDTYDTKRKVAGLRPC